MVGIGWGVRVFVVLVCVGGAVPTASSQRPGQGPPTTPPSVPDAYAFLYSGLRTRDTDFETARQTLPYTSISISHSGCFGTCPIYSATINLDGSASYNGERFVDRTGRFTGKVHLGDFGQLSLLVERSGFMSLADRYTAPWTDDETITVTVVRRKGGAKVVADYGRFAPPEVWALERAIDAVISQIKWAAVGGGH